MCSKQHTLQLNPLGVDVGKFSTGASIGIAFAPQPKWRFTTVFTSIGPAFTSPLYCLIDSCQSRGRTEDYGSVKLSAVPGHPLTLYIVNVL